jgi:DNA-binding CsgD family transcriptional regulator
MIDEASSALIGRIYDCALDKSLWPEVLRRLTERLNGQMADISLINPVRGNFEVLAHYNYPSDLIERMLKNVSINPAAPIGLTAPLCEPLCSSRDIDITAFHNSLYWRNCFSDGPYYDYITVVLVRTAMSFGAWGVLGDRSRGPYSDDDVRFARTISPHIRRSVEISGVLQHQRVAAGALSGTLSALAGGALVLDHDGAIRFLNAEAQAEIVRATLLTESRGRLIGVTPEALQLLANITIGSRRSVRGQDILLTEKGGRVLHASWVELEQANEEFGGSTLLLLRQPEPDLTSPLGTAASFYQLTRAETQVLAMLLNGHSVSDIAKILGVARSTAKSHLDAIFSKTNTNRQADVVRLVVSLISPLRS